MERVYVNGEHSSAIMKSMARLWKERKYCDAVLEINSENLELHKLVLLAASPSIINKVNSITDKGTIVIKLDGNDYSKEAAKLCVQYLYKGVAKLTDANVRGVASIAQALDIKEILSICSSFQDTFKIVKEENSEESSAYDTDTEVDSDQDPEQLTKNLTTALEEALDNIKEIEQRSASEMPSNSDANMEIQVDIQEQSEIIDEFNPAAVDPVVKSEPDMEKETDTCDKSKSVKGKIKVRLKDKSATGTAQITKTGEGTQKTFQSLKQVELNTKPEDEMSSDAVLECPRCDLKIKGRDELMSHIKQVHILKKKFTCSICAKTYSSKQARENHSQSIHTRQCNHCSRFVVEAVPWEEGMDRRSKRVVKCKCGSKVTFCTKFGRSKGSYSSCADTSSARKNVQEKYACVTCGKLFLTKTHCQRHSMTHNDDKVFSCNRCESRFSHQSALKKHEIDIHGVKSLVCTYCGKKFTRLNTLKSHLMKKHSSAATGKSSSR